MPAQVNATGKRIYVNADRSKVVEEHDPEAAFLLAAPGAEVSEEDARRYGLRLGEAPEADPLGDRRDQLARATARGATEEARVLRSQIEDLESQQRARRQPAAEATREEAPAEAKAAEAKAVEAPPATKGK